MSTLSSIGNSFLKGYGSTQDYSILFNSLNKKGSSGSFNMFDISGKSSASNLSANFYTDYASIKNGSYGKLTKSWYAKQTSEAESSSSSEKTAEKPDYAELASTISNTAKTLGGYSQGGGYGSVDTAGSIFDSAT